MLGIYVDDLLLGGPEVKVSKHMLGLRSLVHMGKTQVVDRFLGTTYHVAPMADFTVVTLCQPAYAQIKCCCTVTRRQHVSQVPHGRPAAS